MGKEKWWSSRLVKPIYAQKGLLPAPPTIIVTYLHLLPGLSGPYTTAKRRLVNKRCKLLALSSRGWRSGPLSISVQSLSLLAHRHHSSFSRSAIAGMVQWRRTLLAHCCIKALGLQAFYEELWQAALAEAIRTCKLHWASALIFYLYQMKVAFLCNDDISPSPAENAIIQINNVAYFIAQLVLFHCLYFRRSVGDCAITLRVNPGAFAIGLQIVFRQRRRDIWPSEHG